MDICNTNTGEEIFKNKNPAFNVQGLYLIKYFLNNLITIIDLLLKIISAYKANLTPAIMLK